MHDDRERPRRALGLAPSTLHRWLNDGFIAGEQVTPGAPWRIRVDEELRSLFVENAPEGYVKMFKAMNLLGVSRQTILQRVKRGELKAVHVSRGRAKRHANTRYLPRIPISSITTIQLEM